MKIQSLTVGLRVKHPQYGIGTVKAVSEHLAEIRFDDALRSIDPELGGNPAEPSMAVSGLEISLRQFVESTIETVVDRLGLERTEAVVDQLGVRCTRGRRSSIQPIPHCKPKRSRSKPSSQSHRDSQPTARARAKINSHVVLSDGEKVEMQQYISRCYGSLTTFNLLFKNKEDQFSSKGDEGDFVSQTPTAQTERH
jgi:hypothetical protein